MQDLTLLEKDDILNMIAASDVRQLYVRFDGSDHGYTTTALDLLDDIEDEAKRCEISIDAVFELAYISLENEHLACDEYYRSLLLN